ncbi:hypothetical protein GWI33_006263 [Rhynchophorus ferrugineus]|uniref:Uncharacterized protein n=1 Tax=Rhynchophorus ferrugineus TaxID=354439 RepID=A0A834IKN4_RHYFE|nr:hypothetical protein GWI33_006263 [Rhynchophorus ferrugineus]
MVIRFLVVRNRKITQLDGKLQENRNEKPHIPFCRRVQHPARPTTIPKFNIRDPARPWGGPGAATLRRTGICTPTSAYRDPGDPAAAFPGIKVFFRRLDSQLYFLFRFYSGLFIAPGDPRRRKWDFSCASPAGGFRADKVLQSNRCDPYSTPPSIALRYSRPIRLGHRAHPNRDYPDSGCWTGNNYEKEVIIALDPRRIFDTRLLIIHADRIWYRVTEPGLSLFIGDGGRTSVNQTVQGWTWDEGVMEEARESDIHLLRVVGLLERNCISCKLFGIVMCVSRESKWSLS